MLKTVVDITTQLIRVFCDLYENNIHYRDEKSFHKVNNNCECDFEMRMNFEEQLEVLVSEANVHLNCSHSSNGAVKELASFLTRQTSSFNESVGDH